MPARGVEATGLSLRCVAQTVAEAMLERCERRNKCVFSVTPEFARAIIQSGAQLREAASRALHAAVQHVCRDVRGSLHACSTVVTLTLYDSTVCRYRRMVNLVDPDTRELDRIVGPGPRGSGSFSSPWRARWKAQLAQCRRDGECAVSLAAAAPSSSSATAAAPPPPQVPPTARRDEAARSRPPRREVLSPRLG